MIKIDDVKSWMLTNSSKTWMEFSIEVLIKHIEYKKTRARYDSQGEMKLDQND